MIGIWQKYFFKELCKVFALFICCFYFLYVLIDYASHAKSFGNEGVGYTDIILYYLFQFTKRAEILVPVALMIATIKVMTTANVSNEVVALASSGISLKKIALPFLVTASLCVAFLYVNYQFFYPIGMSKLISFEEAFFHEKERSEKIYPVHQLVLEDNSILIYHSYHPSENGFFDAYWIRHSNDFYRIKLLQPHNNPPIGHYVDHIVRNKKGELVRAQSFKKLELSQMHFDQKTLFSVVTPARQQSLSQLFKTVASKRFSLNNEDLNDRQAQVVTFFFYKMSLPFVCFLAVLAPAPFCLRFGRQHPIFLIYVLSLFGLITFFTLLNSGVILGESKVVPPFFATLTIPTIFIAFFSWKFWRL